MPEVTIEVAGRTYRVGCGEGEEGHLMGLARLLDAEASQLSKQMGQISEGRLMLMSALMLADKLVDAEQRAEAAADPDAQPPLLTPERDAEIAANLDALTARIEALAGRLEGA